MSKEAELAMKRRRNEAHDKSKGKSAGQEQEQEPLEPRLLPSGRRSFKTSFIPLEEFLCELEKVWQAQERKCASTRTRVCYREWQDAVEAEEKLQNKNGKMPWKLREWLSWREFEDAAKNNQEDDQKDDQKNEGKGQEQERASRMANAKTRVCFAFWQDAKKAEEKLHNQEV